MRLFKFGKIIGFTTLTAAAVIFFAVSAGAQETAAIAGKIGVKVARNDSMVVDAARGHVMYLAKGEGSNTATGNGEFMNHAKVVNIGFSDLTRGSGPDNGYLTMALGADTVYNSWNGNVAVRMTGEGKPVVALSGDFTWTGGTGQYEGISGSGTYKCVVVAPDEYVVEWNGSYTLPK